MKSKENQNEIKLDSLRKLSFFKRIYVSIFKVENYGEFVLEKTSIAVKYFFLLLVIITIVTSCISTFQIDKMVKKGISYVRNEMPEFSLNDGEISFSENTEAYDEEMDFYVIYSTDKELSNDDLTELESKIKKYKSALIYLKDKIILYDGISFAKYKYSDIISEYNINISNKQDLIDNFDKIRNCCN